MNRLSCTPLGSRARPADPHPNISQPIARRAGALRGTILGSKAIGRSADRRRPEPTLQTLIGLHPPGHVNRQRLTRAPLAYAQRDDPPGRRCSVVGRLVLTIPAGQKVLEEYLRGRAGLDRAQQAASADPGQSGSGLTARFEFRSGWKPARSLTQAVLVSVGTTGFRRASFHLPPNLALTRVHGRQSWSLAVKAEGT